MPITLNISMHCCSKKRVAYRDSIMIMNLKTGGNGSLYGGNGAAGGRRWVRRSVNADHLYEGHGIEDGSYWSRK